MNSIYIEGGIPLKGQTKIQGSKNAVLPVLAATILVPGVSVIHNCPRIADVYCMVKLLQCLGCRVSWEEDTITVNAGCILQNSLPAEYVIRMRSSITLLGSMLGRVGEVSLQYPGGCVIGERPIDLHQMAMERFGAKFSERESGFVAQCECLRGALVDFPLTSVGATENAVLAAVTAEGTSILINAAMEPEITALCEFLKSAGAKIKGAGTKCLTIEGVRQLEETEYYVPADRIVAGTYLLAGMGAGGEIYLQNAPAGQMEALLRLIREMGAVLRYDESGIWLWRYGTYNAVRNLKTEAYPGFPTDLQSPLMALLTKAQGDSILEETIFQNRFKVAGELNLMGADIEIDESRAYIRGQRTLTGKHIIAQELRGGAALVAAGLMADGSTVVSNRHYIDRGYEDICRDLRNLGAKIASYEQKTEL